MRRGPKALHLNSESEADAGLTKGNQARGEKQTADRTAIANIVANRRTRPLHRVQPHSK